MLTKIIIAMILTLFLTPITALLISKHARSTNLFSEIRGGTPRSVGIIPLIVLFMFLPSPYNYLVGIMGILAFIDDVMGRREISGLPIEWGQLSRGVGMILVSLLGYPLMGFSSILVALMIQPLNIADMQPGAACTSIISISALVSFLLSIKGQLPYIPLLILGVCLSYSPLDYKGRIMMGEVGNHSFAIALGISFHVLDGLPTVLALFFLTTFIIALVRRKNLKNYIKDNMNIENPTFGDCFMDVISGGGFGDLLRKIIFKKRTFKINNKILIFLGFRRLLHNPFVN